MSIRSRRDADESTYSITPSTTPPKLEALNYVNIFAYLVNVVITYGIGVAGIFGFPTNGELSQKYQTLVTPVGWAFAIWGLIFGLQALWAIVPLVVTKQRENPFLYAVGYKYVGVCLAQAAWSVVFSLEVIPVSLICMLVILFALWSIVWSISQTTSPFKGSLANYILWRFPFTIHAGWITAASFVNANVVLVDMGVDANLQYYAALFSLFCLLVIATFTTISLDLIIPLVISWALFGVFAELRNPQESIEERFSEGEIELAVWGSLVFAVLIAIGFLVGLIHQCCRKRPLHSGTSDTADEATYLRAE